MTASSTSRTAILDRANVLPLPSQSPRVDRQPPQDLAAEQSVLGGMLLSKDAIADVVETLRVADFYKPAHSLIFDSILDLYAKGEPADPITVSPTWTGRASWPGSAAPRTCIT